MTALALQKLGRKSEEQTAEDTGREPEGPGHALRDAVEDR
jgi:hypothetical protein